MESKSFVSIIVSTYNRKDMLKNCLEALFNQTYPKDRYEVIVVDDGSTDGTEEAVKSIPKTNNDRLRYFKQPNKGPAAARNLGIKKGVGEIIAFIDDDCIADKEWLSCIVKCFSEIDKLGGVEGKVVSPEGKTPFTHQVENLKGGSYLTANIAYKKECLFEVGLFDESLHYPAGEDWDLSFRILIAGFKIKFCRNAIVTHILIKRNLSDIIRATNIEWSAVDVIYYRYPELFKKTTGHSMQRSFFDGIFLHPFVYAKKWMKYLLFHPVDLPKFIIFFIIRSFIITYHATRVLFKKLIKTT